jgi:hypothetical protein
MASTYSNSLVLELMETGANANTWGNNTNTNLETVDAFTAGYLSKSVAGSTNVTLTTSATTDPTVESANKVLDLNGTLTGNITVFVPQKENNYLVYNNTSGSFTLDVAATGGTGVQIDQGKYEWIYCDGTNVAKAELGTSNASELSSGTLADARLSANVTLNNASTISAGTLDDARLTANVTLNNASTISTGTLDIARLGTTADPQFNSIGVGTTASATTGQIRATDDITAFYSSDVALKENIHNIPSASEKIEQLNGVLFDWKQEYIDNNGGEDGYFVRKSDVGVIAQDVEKVLPEIVGTRPNGIKAVKYDRLCALLIEGFKEMKQEIKQLKESK